MTRPSTPTLRPPAPADDKRQRVLEAALKRTGYKQDALIEVLHSAQNTFGFLTPELLWYVAAQLRVPPSRVYGVATFYNFFSLEPPGEHTRDRVSGNGVLHPRRSRDHRGTELMRSASISAKRARMADCRRPKRAAWAVVAWRRWW